MRFSESQMRDDLPKACPDCGAPESVSQFMQWDSSGCIQSKGRTGGRIVFMRLEELNKTLLCLEDILPFSGVALENISSSFSRSLIWNLMPDFMQSIPPSKITRPGFLMKRVLMHAREMLMVMGMGSIISVDIKPGLETIIFANGCFNLRINAGIYRGGLEALERGDCAIDVFGDNEKAIYRIKTSKSPAGEDYEDFALFEESACANHGKVDQGLCETCKVPIRVSRSFEWKTENGSILERESGQRYVAMPLSLLSGILRFAESRASSTEQLSSQIKKAVSEDSANLKIEEEILKNRNYKALLKKETVLGSGNITSINVTAKSVEISVCNPFSADILAGRYTGYVQRIENQKPELYLKKEVKHININFKLK